MYIYDCLVWLSWVAGKISREELERFKNSDSKEWPENIQNNCIDKDAWWTYHKDMIHIFKKKYQDLNEQEEEEEKNTNPNKKTATKKMRDNQIRFIADYKVWFKRTVQNRYGQVFQSVLPAVFAPISMFIHIMSSVLTLDQGTIQRLKDRIYNLRFTSILHQQGQWLSHFLYYRQELYVVYNLCIIYPQYSARHYTNIYYVSVNIYTI